MTTDAPAAFEEGKKEHLLALLAVTAGQIIWGFSYLFTRLALRTAHPDVLLSMRFLLASGLMTLMVLTGKAKVSFRGKNLRPLILLVLTEPLYFYFESYGILYSNSTFAGVVLAVGSFFGDLTESALKRRCGIKDSGNYIPGMGGALDILDSFIYNGVLLIIMACVFYSKF